MPSVIAAFLGLLFSTLSTNPQALFSSQSVGALWAQAQTQVAATAHPKPTASSIALVDNRDDDGDNDSHRRHHHPYRQHPFRAPSPAAATTPGSSLISAAYPDASSTQIATQIADSSSASVPSPAVAAADESTPADSTTSSVPVRTSSSTVSAQTTPATRVAYAVSPRWTPAPGSQLCGLQGCTINQLYSSSSPLNMKLADQRFTVKQAPLSSAIWDREIFTAGAPVATGIPMYVSTSSDPLIRVANCYKYGGNCGMAGKQVRINPRDLAQPPPYDLHLLVVDPTDNLEVDCWQTVEHADHTPDLSGGTLKCGWGGWYPLHSSGLNGTYPGENDPNNGNGIAFGPAAGLFMVQPQELLDGIHHAIALNSVCLNAPSVFPSDYPGTDATCDGSSNFPHYGDGIQYTGRTDAQIAASSLSVPCKNVLTAMHDYGAYFSDTGNGRTNIDVTSEAAYTLPEMGGNPFPQVYSALTAAGNGSSGSWNNCWDGLSANDFVLFELTPP